MAAVGGVTALYFVVVATFFHDPALHGSARGLGNTNPISRLCEFTLGIACAELLFRSPGGFGRARRNMAAGTAIELGALTVLAIWLLLGNISFAMYLLHQPILRWLRRHPLDLPVAVQIALFVALLLAGSALLYRFVEKPGMALSRRMVGFRGSPEHSVAA